MGQLQDRMIEDLTLRGSAPNTHLTEARRASLRSPLEALDTEAGQRLG